MTSPHTIIIGAGEAGRMLLAEYERRGKGHHVAGFIDDDPGKKGSVISGKQVFGSSELLHEVIRSYSIDEVIIAIPSAKAGVLGKIVSAVMKADPRINIHILPEVEKFFDTVPLTPSLEDVSFADIFDRDEYTVDIGSMKARLSGKTVLITGAGGSIGSDLCRQLLKFDAGRIVALGRGEHSIYMLSKTMNEYIDLMEHRPEMVYKISDVKDAAILEKVFADYRPDIVFHAAAHKHVPLMEFNEAEALKNNVGGTRNVLDLVCRYGVEQCVIVSTDKAVRPVNIMGASKRLSELVAGYYHTAKGCPVSIVRFGNVIGSRGSVIPLFTEQIRRGGPVTVTHPEVTRYFMSIQEAALLVLNSAAYARGGEIFVLDMGKQYRLIDIARRLIELYRPFSEKEIGIAITGLRPGEKLYEELFYDTRNLLKTDNEKIFMLREDTAALGESEYTSLLDAVASGIERFSPLEIRDFIKMYVPEYEYDEIAGDDNGMGRLVQ